MYKFNIKTIDFNPLLTMLNFKGTIDFLIVNSDK